MKNSLPISHFLLTLLVLVVITSPTTYSAADVGGIKTNSSWTANLIADPTQTLEEEVALIINLTIGAGQNFSNQYNYSDPESLKNAPTNFTRMSEYFLWSGQLLKLATGRPLLHNQSDQPIKVRKGARKGYADLAVSVLEQIHSNHPAEHLATAMLARAYLVQGSFSVKMFSFIDHPSDRAAILFNRAIRQSPENVLIRFLRFTPMNFNPSDFSGVDIHEVVYEDYLWLLDKINLVKSRVNSVQQNQVGMIINYLHFLRARYILLYEVNKPSKVRNRQIIEALKKIENPQQLFTALETIGYPSITELLKLKSYIEE